MESPIFHQRMGSFQSSSHRQDESIAPPPDTYTPMPQHYSNQSQQTSFQQPRFPPPSPVLTPQLPYPYPQPSDDPGYSQMYFPPRFPPSRLPTPSLASSSRVDSYRPGVSVGPSRKAEDVYMEEKEKAMTKSDRILNKLSEISTQLIEQQADMTAIKTAMNEDRLQVRDLMIELRAGLRAVPTRQDISDEISNQISTLTEQVQACNDLYESMQSTLPEKVASASAIKLKDLLMITLNNMRSPSDPKLEEIFKRFEHLDAKLDVLDKMSQSLDFLQDIGDSIRDLGVFNATLRAAEARIKDGGIVHGNAYLNVTKGNETASAPPPTSPIPTSLASKEQMNHLLDSIRAVNGGNNDLRMLLYQLLSQPPLFHSPQYFPHNHPVAGPRYFPTPPHDGRRHDHPPDLDMLARTATSQRPPSPATLQQSASATLPSGLGSGNSSHVFTPEGPAPEGVPADEFGPIVFLPLVPTSVQAPSSLSSVAASASPVSTLRVSAPALPTSNSGSKSKVKVKPNGRSLSKKKKKPSSSPTLRAIEVALRSLSPSPDRPFTRSMSSKPLLGRGYITKTGTSKDQAIQVSSGSSRSSHTSPPQSASYKAASSAMTGSALPHPTVTPLEGYPDPSETQEVRGTLHSQSLKASLPTPAKSTPAPPRTYGSAADPRTLSQAHPSIFGDSLTSTPVRNTSSRRRLMDFAAAREKKQSYLRALEGSPIQGGKGGLEGKRRIEINESESMD